MHKRNVSNTQINSLFLFNLARLKEYDETHLNLKKSSYQKDKKLAHFSDFLNFFLSRLISF
jgi:hypothetical protein